jgi:hypothetical protein
MRVHPAGLGFFFRVGSVLTLFLAPGALSESATWRVPSQCPTIHAGLDSTSYGDTVLVAPGTYQLSDDPETWIAPGPGIRLVSEDGPDVTIIEFCEISTAIALYQCEGARVNGFTMRFGTSPGCLSPPVYTSGVECVDCTDVIVENCIIDGLGNGIYVRGSSSEWWKPVFRHNTIRSCGFGVYLENVIDSGRPYFQGNTITSCSYGAWVWDSSPMFRDNTIASCSFFAAEFYGHCGGGWDRNLIANNAGGIDIHADPPLAAPSFNGGWMPEDANDFLGNRGKAISFSHSPGDGFVMAIYNYWGTDCPESSLSFTGSVIFEPWVDSTHTQILNHTHCPGATEPTTWGAIKAMYR